MQAVVSSMFLCCSYDPKKTRCISFARITLFYSLIHSFLQVYMNPPGFSCPGVPIVPAVCIFFNIFLFAQVCSRRIPSTILLTVAIPQFHIETYQRNEINTSKLITNSFSLQLHYEAWVRFVILSLISIGIYAFYGQYHADPLSSNETIIYHRAPIEEGQ